MKTKLSKLWFGKSDRGDGLPHQNSPRYSMPKVFRASTLRSRSPNDQAARLAKKGKEAQAEPDVDPSEEGGQVRRPRDFLFVGHANEDLVRKQNTTFEGLAKRGVIAKSALEPLMKADK